MKELNQIHSLPCTHISFIYISRTAKTLSEYLARASPLTNTQIHGLICRDPYSKLLCCSFRRCSKGSLRPTVTCRSMPRPCQPPRPRHFPDFFRNVQEIPYPLTPLPTSLIVYAWLLGRLLLGLTILLTLPSTLKPVGSFPRETVTVQLGEILRVYVTPALAMVVSELGRAWTLKLDPEPVLMVIWHPVASTGGAAPPPPVFGGFAAEFFFFIPKRGLRASILAATSASCSSPRLARCLGGGLGTHWHCSPEHWYEQPFPY